jgi:hypothetical protein
MNTPTESSTKDSVNCASNFYELRHVAPVSLLLKMEAHCPTIQHDPFEGSPPTGRRQWKLGATRTGHRPKGNQAQRSIDASIRLAQVLAADTSDEHFGHLRSSTSSEIII